MTRTEQPDYIPQLLQHIQSKKDLLELSIELNQSTEAIAQVIQSLRFSHVLTPHYVSSHYSGPLPETAMALQKRRQSYAILHASRMPSKNRLRCLLAITFDTGLFLCHPLLM